MVGGRLYDAATLDEAGTRARARPKYWWEQLPSGKALADLEAAQSTTRTDGP